MRVVHIVIAHAQKLSKILYNIYLEGNTYILLQYWEGIWGNIPFKIDRIGPTKGREDTEVENSPILPDRRNYNNKFII